MHRSVDRILTTQVGSLYRTDELLELYEAKFNDRPYDPAELDAVIRRQTDENVRLQDEIGIDVPSDGEPSRFSFREYFSGRVTGLERRAGSIPALPPSRDRREFADFYAHAATHYWGAVEQPETHLVCVGPITYLPEAARADIANFRQALRGHTFSDAFFPAEVPTAPSMLTIENEYYDSDEEFTLAFAEALREEYRLLVEAGFVVQLDDPFLVHEWEYGSYADIDAYRRWIEQRVELFNHMLGGLPEDQLRLHVCWGSWHGPHAYDLPLGEFVDLMLKINTGAYSIEAANPRHEHEWEVWEQARLPEGKILIPGVVTHKSYVIEHPDLVAQRIVRYADLVGRENVIAAPDCGMGGRIHPQLGWAKLRAMVQGAGIASRRLWKGH